MIKLVFIFAIFAIATTSFAQAKPLDLDKLFELTADYQKTFDAKKYSRAVHRKRFSETVNLRIKPSRQKSSRVFAISVYCDSFFQNAPKGVRVAKMGEHTLGFELSLPKKIAKEYKSGIYKMTGRLAVVKKYYPKNYRNPEVLFFLKESSFARKDEVKVVLYDLKIAPKK